MISPWSWIKNKRPVDISLKKRTEGSVTIIYGKQLDMCYLNKIAGRFVELSDGNHTVGNIVTKMLLLYDVNEQELQNDIIELIRELQWKRLIKLED